MIGYGNDIYRIGSPEEGLGRYIFSAPFCYRKKVLVVGTKYGTGAKFITNFANEVHGVDSRDQFNERNYGNSVKFFRMDISKELPNEKYDVVLCLDIAQRVNSFENIPELVSNCLNKDGYFIFSLPKVNRSKDMEFNSHVKDEFTQDDMKKLIGSNFNIELLVDYFNISWVAIAKKK